MIYDPNAYSQQQDAEELGWFVDFLVAHKVRSFLEIGSRFGQTLWAVGQALPIGSVIASVDRPADDVGRNALIACRDALNDRGLIVNLIEGDSRNASVVRAVHDMGKFDAIFIDADHKIESVCLDWINYGPLARLVGFHDVGFVYDRERLAQTKPNKPIEQKRIDVPDLWQVLKDRFPGKTFECVRRPGKWGIGVLVR